MLDLDEEGRNLGKSDMNVGKRGREGEVKSERGLRQVGESSMRSGMEERGGKCFKPSSSSSCRSNYSSSAIFFCPMS